MNTNVTIEKMQQMRLHGLKKAYEASFETGQNNSLSNDEFLAWLIEAEWDERIGRKTERLVKAARFRYQASIEEISFSPERELDRNLFTRLADCSFIDRGENIIITGSTGAGKSFLATALGYQACLKGYKTMYFNLGRLFNKLTMAKAGGTYMKELGRIEKQNLLILDDFGLQVIDNEKQLMLLDIIEDRHGKKSTIITSQIPVKVWHELLEEKTIADAFLDRVTHSAHRFELKGESMRKKMKNQ